MRRNAICASALTFALACSIGCGAKTGLRVPCEVPLEPQRVPVVLVLDHSGSMLAMSADGRTAWTVVTDTLGQVLPPFDDALDLGALWFPLPRVGLMRACDVEAAVGVPLARGNADAVVDYLERSGTPSGGTPVFSAIGVAALALRDRRPRDTAAFIILGTDGVPACNLTFTRETCECPQAMINACVGSDGIWGGCYDDVRVAALLRDLAADHIFTLVVGVEFTQTATSERAIRALDAMATAGGRPAAGATRYYRAANATGLTAALESGLAPLAYCQLRVTDRLQETSDRMAFASRSAQRTFARDPTRREGWDWVDRTAGTIELFGAACELAVQAHGRQLVLVSAEHLCTL